LERTTLGEIDPDGSTVGNQIFEKLKAKGGTGSVGAMRRTLNVSSDDLAKGIEWGKRNGKFTHHGDQLILRDD
jgi:hypothetical protein